MLGFGLRELIVQASGLVELLLISVLVARQVDRVSPQIKQTAWLFPVFGYKEVLVLNQNVGEENVLLDKKM